jgi:polyhydroxyalkanoate synthesis regulator phasin
MQNPEKSPDEWASGGEPMTEAQKAYLQNLAREAKESFDEHLSKAEASKKIEELQRKTGKGGRNTNSKSQ